MVPVHRVEKIMVGQIQNSPYPAMKDHFLIELYHMEHFLCQPFRSSQILWWIEQYEGPSTRQKCADQNL